MVHPNRRTPLTGQLIDRIQRDGPIRFDEFMRDCLYHPEHGYYTSQIPKSGRRDFFTSPEVGAGFAKLLAFQFTEMWERLDHCATFHIVECGAGDGRLANSLLSFLQKDDPKCFAALNYWFVEASPALREQAAHTLSPFDGKVEFFPDLPRGSLVGCIFSNELLDAFPVRRFVQRDEELREILIGTRDTKKGMELAEVEGGPVLEDVSRYLERYGVPLSDGQVVEINLAALEWLERVSASLVHGYLLTVDYGHRARELYAAAHLRGTLLAYRDHRSNEDWLGWPGLQDLTAHVNFTALEEYGRELELPSVGYVTQTQFLMALARASGYLDLLQGDPSDRERIERVEQFKQLIHPGGMGETFKVLVQRKGAAVESLSGLEPL